MSVLLLLMWFAPDVERANIYDLIEPPSERLNPPVLLAPGGPPVLGFRYFYAKEHGRAADLGLVMDDAGH